MLGGPRIFVAALACAIGWTTTAIAQNGPASEQPFTPALRQVIDGARKEGALTLSYGSAPPEYDQSQIWVKSEIHVRARALRP